MKNMKQKHRGHIPDRFASWYDHWKKGGTFITSFAPGAKKVWRKWKRQQSKKICTYELD